MLNPGDIVQIRYAGHAKVVLNKLGYIVDLMQYGVYEVNIGFKAKINGLPHKFKTPTSVALSDGYLIKRTDFETITGVPEIITSKIFRIDRTVFKNFLSLKIPKGIIQVTYIMDGTTGWVSSIKKIKKKEKYDY